ncbi:motilin receptor [Macrotis lagotis]|uniref:motilin receptor n=1 Tax=Macrotis lagotis TaxID=92651 RepID=UPI003D685B5E
MGAPRNASGPAAAPWPLPRCDHSRCSPFPLGALAAATAVCLALFALGVSGNVLTVLLARRARDARSTARLYLGSLALADLLVLLGLPFDLYRLWRSRPWVFGQLLCRLSLYLGEGGTYAGLLHVTALSLERYLAICHPLRARRLVTRRRVRALLAALWALALLSAGPFLFLVGVEQDPGPGGAQANGTGRAGPEGSAEGSAAAAFSRECRPSPARRGALRLMLWVTTAYFFVPLLCLSVLHGLIGRALGRRGAGLRGPGGAGRERDQRRTLRVLVVVVLAFVVCWLPFHVGRIIYINAEDSRTMYFSQYFNIVALQLFYLSASINPILYNLISKKYRAAAYKLLLARQSGEKGSGTRNLGGETAEETGAETAGSTETTASFKKEHQEGDPQKAQE